MLVSSESKNYVALVWGGTHDPRTGLTDIDFRTVPFGNQKYWLPRDIRVHSGFNSYVFDGPILDNMIRRLYIERSKRRSYNPRIFTTGHSLGASSSIFSAVALALHYQNTTLEPIGVPEITSLNFGCPRTGNVHWRNFFADQESSLLKSINVWRFVLGLDIVPRLPKLFYHVGHTIQMSHRDGKSRGWKPTVLSEDTVDALDSSTGSAEKSKPTHKKSMEKFRTAAYYQHYGDANLGFTSLPSAWDYLPFTRLPESVRTHLAIRYWMFFHAWGRRTIKNTSSTSNGDDGGWTRTFVTVEENNFK